MLSKVCLWEAVRRSLRTEDDEHLKKVELIVKVMYEEETIQGLDEETKLSTVAQKGLEQTEEPPNFTEIWTNPEMQLELITIWAPNHEKASEAIREIQNEFAAQKRKRDEVEDEDSAER